MKTKKRRPIIVVRTPKLHVLSCWLVLLCLSPRPLWQTTSHAQTIKQPPAPGAKPASLRYHGLVPGESTAGDVRQALGKPASEAKWYAYKMLYEVEGRPGVFDAVYTLGADGVVGTIEAASIPAGYEDATGVRGKLGEPEFELRLAKQSTLDYSARGLRFWFDRAGKTIGVVYFPHGYTRVPAGQPRRLDLSGLPQSPPESAGGTSSPRGWQVGTARRPITPLEKDWLPHPNWTVHDDMHARAMVLTDGKTRIAWVAADLFGASLSEIRPIEERLAAKGWPNLIVAMSHNHAAPDTIGVYGHYPAAYIAYIQEQIADAVLAAAADLQPVAAVRAATRELPMTGGHVQGLLRNARNPGIIDPQLAILQFVGEGNKVLATLVNFACHPEGLEKGWEEISADFPGVMCAAVEASLGGRCLFLNGAVGGMVTGDTKARTQPEARVAGMTWARHVVDLAEEAVPLSDYRLELIRHRVELPATNPKLLQFLVETKRREQVRGRVVSELNLIRIGHVEIVTIPGELLPELSFEIQAKMTGWPRMIVGIANDELGYIIPAWDFRASTTMTMEGWDYEETMSLGPATGLIIRNSALRLLEETN